MRSKHDAEILEAESFEENESGEYSQNVKENREKDDVLLVVVESDEDAQSDERHQRQNDDAPNQIEKLEAGQVPCTVFDRIWILQQNWWRM